MCARFTLTEKDARKVAAELGALLRPEHAALWRPRYNVAPTDVHWAVRSRADGKELVPARWTYGADKDAASIVNARSETAARLGLFKHAFAKRRCLVPADGFFEWTGARDARRPLWYHPRAAGLVLFAGLYEEREPAELGFTILTVPANVLIAPVHDRMPALLTPQEAEEWLAPTTTPERLALLLAPAPDDRLVATPVSRRVNSVANDDAECLAPAAPPPQLSLL